MFAKTGMAFNFQVGFQNLVDKTKAKNGNDKASHYSVIIADTVMVTEGVCLFFHFLFSMVHKAILFLFCVVI